jgi:hypothetical protein
MTIKLAVPPHERLRRWRSLLELLPTPLPNSNTVGIRPALV